MPEKCSPKHHAWKPLLGYYNNNEKDKSFVEILILYVIMAYRKTLFNLFD